MEMNSHDRAASVPAVRIFWLEVVSQGGRDDGLYGVHPVLGLIEYK